jgi:hypothetical protein
MQYSALQAMIINSTKTGWLTEEEPYVFTSTDDVQINIEIKMSDEIFCEGWTDRFADKTACRAYAHLRYSGAFVVKVLLISVDGGRYLIPSPSSNHDISIFYNKIGRIINNHSEGYENAIARAGITEV